MSKTFDREEWLNLPNVRAAYSDRTAWAMAKFSKLAYSNDAEAVKAEIAPAGLTDVRLLSIDSTDSQAFVAWGPEYAVVAFRGTEGKERDIRVDLEVRWRNSKTGERHEGFEDAYNSIKPAILGVFAIVPAGLPVYLTGHSLGGALALNAASDMESDRLAACYTFGSPRVGKEDLNFQLKCPVYRVVNHNDFVPDLPPTFLGYSHCGIELRMPGDGKIHRSRNVLWRLWTFLRRLGAYLAAAGARAISKKNLPPGLADHLIDNYIAELVKVSELAAKRRVKIESFEKEGEALVKSGVIVLPDPPTAP